ncbi:hypothetical protein BBO_07976 [Beauveria brongniartii RCEF 3172]|uniref:Kazal-like domain-containing protein n=1 Tax=Beauveria brongniartii RCEF 3172 TaxID=1081107 RepID=A0A166YAF4_9HYPO|nr:hypothetical protein BBO_07976 [Beauveria brongniartii RCEF 3172]
MKLAAVIFALATVVSSIPMEQHRCDGICTAEYDPIVCSNGIVYGNACELVKAKVGILDTRPDQTDIGCNPQAFDGVTCGSGIRE